MNRLPTEILALVADFLPLVSLREFRLVSRRLASAGSPILTQHLCIVDTAECLEDFQRFLRQNQVAARCAKKLTIYYGSWPVCTRDDWETHPLLLGGRHRTDVGRQRSQLVDQAYRDYRDFILREGSREPSDLLAALRGLPNLRSIALTPLRASHHQQPQYSRLRKRIWLQPYMRDSASPTVTWVLGALNSFCRVIKLEIKGSINPYDIDGPVRADFVEILKITSLRCSDSQKLSRFLSSFGRLRELSLEMHDIAGGTAIPLDQVLWPNLEVLELTNGRVSEISMVSFIQRHTSLSVLRVQGTSMIGGSWESVLRDARLRSSPGAGAVVTHASRFPDASSHVRWAR